MKRKPRKWSVALVALLSAIVLLGGTGCSVIDYILNCSTGDDNTYTCEDPPDDRPMVVVKTPGLESPKQSGMTASE